MIIDSYYTCYDACNSFLIFEKANFPKAIPFSVLVYIFKHFASWFLNFLNSGLAFFNYEVCFTFFSLLKKELAFVIFLFPQTFCHFQFFRFTQSIKQLSFIKNINIFFQPFLWSNFEYSLISFSIYLIKDTFRFGN